MTKREARRVARLVKLLEDVTAEAHRSAGQPDATPAVHEPDTLATVLKIRTKPTSKPSRTANRRKP